MWRFGAPQWPHADFRVLLIGAVPIAGVRPLAEPAGGHLVHRESRVVWECSPKTGGKLHLRLNTDTSPIADKYREGKLKRTLKREFNST